MCGDENDKTDEINETNSLLWLLNLKQSCELKREGDEKKFRFRERILFYFILFDNSNTLLCPLLYY